MPRVHCRHSFTGFVFGHKIGVLRSSALFQGKDFKLQPSRSCNRSAYADIHDNRVAYDETLCDEV